MNLRRATCRAGFIVLSIGILIIGAWSAAAIWYCCGYGEPVRSLLAAISAVISLGAIGGLMTRRRWALLGVYTLALMLLLVWWGSISPSAARHWAPDVARSVTASFDGDHVSVTNVRNFSWRSESEFDPVWEQRTYDLSHVTDVDLIMSYWMGEAIAHTIVSFGFDNAERLAFSIEIRKEATEIFSPLAGFFKQYELAIIAADERDIVRLRSNVRDEDVRLYRLKMTPENARLLLRSYLEAANGLAKMPRFYNTLTSNCTTLVFDMARVIHPGLSPDIRIILSGYLPDYAYEFGATNTRMPFAELRNLSKINHKALQADAEPNFSMKIREGVPPALQ